MAISALIGSRLREYRLASGLRQSELAAKAAISPAYLNLIEHNRRKLTPEVLERLVAALGAELAEFDDSGPDALIADLREAAALMPELRAEAERAGEFAGRFPGWARLLAAGSAHNTALRQALAALNDRLAHDPGLSSALHELLSALSGVRATAQILAGTEDLSPDWQRKFQQNLFQDSERLVEGAQTLITWLDAGTTEAESIASSPRDELEAWLVARNWSLGDSADDLGAARQEVARLATAAGRQLARDWLGARAREMAQMPGEAFARALAETGPDPALLAARFHTSVIAAMHRIALWPGAEAGLVLCDGSGSLLFRKPLRGFAVPRLGAACPLWPLFQALVRPGQPLAQEVEMPLPGAHRFRCLGFCETSQPWGFAGPELRLSAMLILATDPGSGAGQGLALPLGPTCRLCPREACPARREPSVLRQS